MLLNSLTKIFLLLICHCLLNRNCYLSPCSDLRETTFDSVTETANLLLSLQQNSHSSDITEQQFPSGSQLNYEFNFNTDLPLTTESRSLANYDLRQTTFDSVTETANLLLSLCSILTLVIQMNSNFYPVLSPFTKIFLIPICHQQLNRDYCLVLIFENQHSIQSLKQQTYCCHSDRIFTLLIQMNSNLNLHVLLNSLNHDHYPILKLPYSDPRETVFDLVTETEKLLPLVCQNSSGDVNSNLRVLLNSHMKIFLMLICHQQRNHNHHLFPLQKKLLYLTCLPAQKISVIVLTIVLTKHHRYLLCTQESSSVELSVYQPMLMLSLPTFYDKKLSFCRRSLFDNNDNLENREELTSVFFIPINLFSLE